MARSRSVLLLLYWLPLAALAFRRGWVGPLLLLLWLAPPPDAYALGWDDLWLHPDQRATPPVGKGQASRAAQLFDQPDWRAAAQYQADDYAQAVQSWGLPAQKATTTAAMHWPVSAAGRRARCL